MRFLYYDAMLCLFLGGCASPDTPILPANHPASVHADQSGVTAPSELLNHHHPMPGPAEGRQLKRSDGAMGAMDHSMMGDMSGMKMDGAMGDQNDMDSYYGCTMHPDVHSDKPGYCPECGMTLIKMKETKHGDMSGMDMGGAKEGMDMEPAGADSADAYTCSMHPEVQAAGPGFCPKCGMALVKKESAPDSMKGISHDQ